MIKIFINFTVFSINFNSYKLGYSSCGFKDNSPLSNDSGIFLIENFIDVTQVDTFESLKSKVKRSVIEVLVDNGFKETNIQFVFIDSRGIL